MSLTPVRRSRRTPKPNTRYEGQLPWTEDTLRLPRRDSPTEIGQDVNTEDVMHVEESEEEESSIPQESRSVTNVAQTPSLPASDGELEVQKRRKSRKRDLRSSRKEVHPRVFGPKFEDLYPILQSRDIWHLDPRDVVFPSRASPRKQCAYTQTVST